MNPQPKETEQAHTAERAVWDRLENMGASQLAIDCAQMILEDLKTLPAELHGMLIAARVDAALRKSGAPEMFAAIERIDANAAESVEWIRRECRSALAQAKGGAK